MKNKYLYLAQFDPLLGSGIFNKIIEQVEGLNKIEPTDLCLIEDKQLTLNRKNILLKSNSIFSKINMYIKLYTLITKKRYNFIYVRNISGINSFFLLILTIVLRKKVKFNIEIPTYPFNGEIKTKGVKSFISKLIRTFVQSNYKYTIQTITYMGDYHKEIWGIPAIKFDNGINVDRFPLKVKNELEDTLHIIGVASLDFWHGYDRLIKGISGYKKKVVFHIVGDGIELNNLKNLVKKYEIKDKVIFHGRLYDTELDSIFEKCHIAIDSLGRHRTGNDCNSSLKSKEYTARGIPFIQSHLDGAFKKCNFVLKIPADESPVDLEDIHFWYSRLTISPTVIRKFAVKNFQWKTQFEKLNFD